MQVRRLTVHNIGIIEHLDLGVEKSLNLFYGDIRQGKTTVLNSVRWVFGGEFPADIIRHGQEEAYIELSADDEGTECVIRREWYRNKEGVTTNRPLTYYRAGAAQQRPAEALKGFLNPFILNDRYFTDLTLLEQRRFMVRLFGIDTRAEDKKLGELVEAASQLRLEIKAFGEVIPVEVSAVDVGNILAQRAEIVAKHSANRDRAAAERKGILDAAHAEWQARVDQHKIEMARIEDQNHAVRDYHAETSRLRSEAASVRFAVTDLESQIRGLELRLEQLRSQHSSEAEKVRELDLLISRRDSNTPAYQTCETSTPDYVAPDTSALDAIIASDAPTAELDKRIHDAGAQNERHAAYLRDCDKRAEKDAMEARLIQMERDIADLRAAKVAKLRRLGEQSGVPTLEFEVDGDYRFDGTTSEMLSDSQQMMLSEHLKGRYPDGLAVSLVDRGESLGKSVFKLVERAKAHNRTILCTVVGDKPAVLPDDVGAFVVEKGVVS